MVEQATPAEGRGPETGEPLRFRDDDPVGDPAVTVEAFLVQPDARAVRIEPGTRRATCSRIWTASRWSR